LLTVVGTCKNQPLMLGWCYSKVIGRKLLVYKAVRLSHACVMGGCILGARQMAGAGQRGCFDCEKKGKSKGIAIKHFSIFFGAQRERGKGRARMGVDSVICLGKILCILGLKSGSCSGEGGG